MRPRNAIYPGSFDPITFGHLDILMRAIRLFDHVYVAVLRNSEKTPLFTVEERLDMWRESVGSAGAGQVTFESFDGLAVEYARRRQAIAMVRGLRAVSDFEAEFKLATANRHLGAEIEMVYLMTSNEHSFLSSTIVKEVASMGGNVESWVPGPVARRLKAKYGHGEEKRQE